jgi:sodium/bile acid cotransporter 7
MIIRKFLIQAGIDGFLILLVSAVVLAWIFPAIGAGKGSFSLSTLANYGISVIFFFYGLRLSREKLRTGLGNWRLHILIHVATFVLFPVLILSIRPLFSGENNVLLWLGIFYLAVLPSTVSSSVVMVSIAGGNIPAAIFNASISSLIGVFITPLWMSLILSGAIGFDAANLWSIIVKLVMQVLLPVVLGMTLNRRWGAFAEKYNRTLRMFDQSVILLIVYTSFCASFAHHVFDGFSWTKIIACTAGMLLLFAVVYGIIGLICRYLKMNRGDTIAAQFCGSKKSLVHGTAMSKVIFAGYSGTGVILLPIMLYHALQLMVVSAIARNNEINN